MKTARNILLVAVSLVAATVLALVFFSEPILKAVLTAQISARSGLEARLSGAHFELWPNLRIKATGLELRRPNAVAEVPVFSADELGFSLPYGPLLSFKPQVVDIGLAHPVIRVEAAMHLPRSNDGTPAKSGPDVAVLGPFTVTDGVIIDENIRRRATGRIDGIRLRAIATHDGGLNLSLDAQAFGQTIHADAKAASSADLAAGRPTRVDVAAMANASATPALVVRTNLRVNSTLISFADLAGTWQSSKVNGSGNVRLDGDAPAITSQLQVDRLDFGALDPGTPSASQDPVPLSDAKLDLKSLRLFDADVDVKATELHAGRVTLANAGLKTTLDKGLLRLALPSVDIYQGKVAANVSVDASQDMPTQTVKLAITSVKAGPLLGDLGGTKVDGTLSMHADLVSHGDSVKAIMSNLGGAADFAVKDGVVTGHKMPDLFRNVSTYLPSAWRSLSDKITVDSMTATFAIVSGVAATEDLRIVSPVADVNGKGDINLVDRTFDLRFDPKVKNGDPKKLNPLDLGASILVRGPWSDPQISADLSGLLSDPNKALNTLQGLGQQFLGGDSDKNTNGIPADDLVKGLGGMLKGFGQ